MITIELRNIELHAYHGIFPGEEKTGSPYIVNCEVTYDEKDRNFDNISDTISYADLFGIIKKSMSVPVGLIEKVCDSIITHIRHQYPFITEIDLSIYKLKAPIEEFNGKVGVRMNRKFNA